MNESVPEADTCFHSHSIYKYHGEKEQTIVRCEDSWVTNAGKFVLLSQMKTTERTNHKHSSILNDATKIILLFPFQNQNKIDWIENWINVENSIALTNFQMNPEAEKTQIN